MVRIIGYSACSCSLKRASGESADVFETALGVSMSALHTPFRGGLLKGMSGLPLYSGGRLFDDVAKYRAIRVAAAGGYR